MKHLTYKKTINSLYVKIWQIKANKIILFPVIFQLSLDFINIYPHTLSQTSLYISHLIPKYIYIFQCLMPHAQNIYKNIYILKPKNINKILLMKASSHNLKLNFFLIILMQIFLTNADDDTVITIPLTYAYTSDKSKTIPIQISFDNTETVATTPTNILFLYNANISLLMHSLPQNNPTKNNNSLSNYNPLKNYNPLSNYPKMNKGLNNESNQNESSQKIIIGLKYPSDFISSISATYKVQYSQIQFGMDNYLQVIINDNNFVQSQDIFTQNINYMFHAVYNYGEDVYIQDKPVKLIDGQDIFFDEFLIRQVLNNINDENKINFKFHLQNHTISLFGDLNNFPTIDMIQGSYVFRLTVKESYLNYIPATDKTQTTLIGYKSMHDFSKFRFTQTGDVIFQRTSILYLLYLFLAYFALFTLLIIIYVKKQAFASSEFVKNILKWTIMKDRTARTDVLRTQLE